MGLRGGSLKKRGGGGGGEGGGGGGVGGVVDRKARGLVSFLQQLRSSDVVVNV